MKITIYTTKGCPDCYGLKQWLNYKNIPYTEIDIEEPGISEYLKNKYGVRVAYDYSHWRSVFLWNI